MEIVLFACMMIVPFVSLAALVIGYLAIKRVAALKKLVLELSKLATGNDPVRDYMVNEI